MSFFNRKEWGAREGQALVGLDKDAVKGVALHWPAMTTPIKTVTGCFSALRSWQAYHMDTRGWADIAYQLAFDQLGNTYQLRGVRHRSAANGDRETNEEYGAFLLIVAPGERPSPKMVRNVNAHLRGFQDEYFPHATRVVGHRDIRPEPTDCPGDIVAGMIQDKLFHF